ncbi:MAG TPA: TolC family protein [Caldimonas sp.]|jgi:NodT family efflux transporter outer membrane factor (OMF) lipoprotein
MATDRSPRFAAAALLAAIATGCALKAPPSHDELLKDALPHADVPSAFKNSARSSQNVAEPWLASFTDPALSALVAEALAYNTDLRAAAAAVEQATGYVAVASASLLPTVNLIGLSSGKSSSGGNSALNGVFLNASLELDIWGRVRYEQAAAREQSAAVQADFAYARQSLAAMVAKSWFLAIEATMQREIVLESLDSSEALHRLAQDRLRIGNGNEQSVAEASANVGGFRDTLRQVELSREQALRALELLLGRYPAAEIAVASTLSPPPPPPPVGLPSELLERRPDVIAAERRVAAAFDRVGEARAAQLPRISLTAGGSSISSDVLVLKDRSNPVWGFGGNLVAPLYQGGALRAQVDIRTAEQKQAVAAYASAGLRAFNEVEGALSAENALRDRAAVLDATVRDNERALELVRIQYRVGSADLRVVEQRQLALYSARTTRLQVQSQQLAQRVNLYLALGGGFESPRSATANDTSTAPPGS